MKPSEHNRRAGRILLAGMAVVAALSAASDAEAAIFLARRVLGRVETMSQPATQPSVAGYDSATVMLEAPAQKVYATALSALRRAKEQGITVTSFDDEKLLIQFTNGEQIAGMKVSALGDKLAQMLITSAHTGSQPNAAALVSQSVLRVCREMNVECSRAQQ